MSTATKMIPMRLQAKLQHVLVDPTGRTWVGTGSKVELPEPVTLVEAQNSKYFAHSLGMKWRPCPHVQSKRCQTTMQAFLEWHRSFCMHCFDKVVVSMLHHSIISTAASSNAIINRSTAG
jgi:hypothetical protein